MTPKKPHERAEPADLPSESPAPSALNEEAHAGVPVETPDAAIARLEEERDALKDKYLRLAAEYENFRKRTTKERAEVWVKAQADLVQRLVDALDDLSRFAHVDPAVTDAKAIHEGVDLVERKFWKELESIGVGRIDQTGVPFDPKVHEAVTTAPADAAERDHTVGTVLQAGYKLGELLLRPARVIVLTWKAE